MLSLLHNAATIKVVPQQRAFNVSAYLKNVATAQKASATPKAEQPKEAEKPKEAAPKPAQSKSVSSFFTTNQPPVYTEEQAKSLSDTDKETFRLIQVAGDIRRDAEHLAQLRSKAGKVPYVPPPKSKEGEPMLKHEMIDHVKQKLPFNKAPYRYAFLLYSTYKNEGTLPNMLKEVKQLSDALREGQELRKIALTRSPKNEVKKKLATYLEKNKLPKNIHAFLRVVANWGRLKEIYIILRAFMVVVKRVNDNIHPAKIVTAQKMTDAQRKEILDKIRVDFKLAADAKIDLKEEVDPTIQGGYRLTFDDQFALENTVKATTTKIGAKIKKTISEHLDKEEEKLNALKIAAFEEANQ